jgi:uncharacterized protein YgbK (DUF1537 family)
MTDANLVRVMQRQSRGRVGLVDYRSVQAGPPAIVQRMAALRAEGISLAIVDATSDADLLAMGRAFADLPLVVAGSGVAIGLPPNFGIEPSVDAARLPAAQGLRAVVSGSCSLASNAQVRAFIGGGGAAMAIDPMDIAAGRDVVGPALAWAAPRLAAGPVLVYATAAPDAVHAVQRQLGVQRAGEWVEQALAAISKGLVALGVRQLVVAGGETSGACVQALGIAQLRIGSQIDPGVPWCHAACPDTDEGGLHLALKSGNFGSEDFFAKAFQRLT